MTTTARVLLLVGGVVVALALFLLLFPVNSGDDDCGSVFAPRNPEFVGEFCSDARERRAFLALPLGIVGLGMIGGSLLFKKDRAA